jgi:agmatinase
MRLPYVRDLANVDFAVIGVPFDTASTYRVGARFGPEAIRSASVLLRPFNPSLEIGPFDHLSGVDYGDIPVVPGYLAESQEKIREETGIVLDANVTPIALGGDHSISLPLLRAVAKKHGSVALIHFDSHGDVWKEYFGGKDTHGTPFRRAIEERLLDVERSTQLGLRGSVYSMKDIQQSRDLGFQLFTSDEMRKIGLRRVLDAVKERVGEGPCYLTFDIDFVDPAYAPATGTPETGGFTSWETLCLIRGLESVNFVAFDLVELSPPYDNPGNISALLASNLVFEFISILALNAKHGRFK